MGQIDIGGSEMSMDVFEVEVKETEIFTEVEALR